MDFQEATRNEQMKKEVLSKADLIRELLPKYDEQARQLLDHEFCLDLGRMLVGGSGDSHDASLATELMFEAVAGVPTEALASMHLGRYTAPWVQGDTRNLLFTGISASGRSSRVIEALRLADDKGIRTLAVTGNDTSPIVQGSDLLFHAAIDEPANPPHVRSYLASLMALYAIALRLAEVREVVTSQEARAWYETILHSADVVEATINENEEKTKELAEILRDREFFIFCGSGPNYGTALFGAAKIVEATGLNAMGQETEEWAHLQRFARMEGTPTFVIAPPGLGYQRASILAQTIKKTGKYLIAVVDQHEKAISEHADFRLPVMGKLPEPLTPLIYSTALSLFASDLAYLLDEPYMRNLAGRWATSPETDAIVRGDETVGEIDDLGLSQVTSVG